MAAFGELQPLSQCPNLKARSRHSSIRFQPELSPVTVSGLDGMTAVIPLQNLKSLEACFSPR